LDLDTAIQRQYNADLLVNADFQSLFDDFYFNIDNEIALERLVKNLKDS